MNTIQLSDAAAGGKYSKEFDVVKTNLLLSLKEKKTVSFLPASWGKEAAMLTVQIAEAYARGQRKVLLLNADPANQSFFESAEDGTGLFDALAGEADPESCIYETETAGLSIMPAGEQPSSASELLVGLRFAEILESLKKQFDYVFLLLPAMDKSLDGVAAASVTDGCVVIAYTNTAFSEIRNAAALLQKSTDVVGSILIRNTAVRKRKSKA